MRYFYIHVGETKKSEGYRECENCQSATDLKELRSPVFNIHENLSCFAGCMFFRILSCHRCYFLKIGFPLWLCNPE